MSPDRVPTAESVQLNVAEQARALYDSAEFNRIVSGAMAVEVGKRFGIKVYAIELDEDKASPVGLSKKLLLLEDLQHHGASCSHDTPSNSVGYLLIELDLGTFTQTPRTQVSRDRYAFDLTSPDTLSSRCLRYITGVERLPGFFEKDFAEYLAHELAELKKRSGARTSNLAEVQEASMPSDLIWLKIINRDREIATSS